MKSTPLLFVLLILVAPLFFLGGPSYHSVRSMKAGWDLGHTFFFFIVTILCCRCIRPDSSRRTWKHYGLLFLGVLFLGIVIELLQLVYTGRSPDPYDVIRNQLGCLLAIAWVMHRGEQRQKRMGARFFQILVLGGGLAALQPLVTALIDEQVARARFPVLSDFETPFERMRWNNPKQLTIQKEIVRHGKKAAKVQLSTAQYSGVSLFYLPKDWSGFKTMQVSVYNPLDDKLALHCRIHDIHHKTHDMVFADRFHHKFILQQGWNDLTVLLDQVLHAPAGREMDMEHVESVGFFVIRQAVPKVIYLDHLYLKR